MNDIQKNRIRRFLQRFGVRITRASSWRYTYDCGNFPKVPVNESLVILDVGANIGQSSLWFKKSFPTATVYAFEPLPGVYSSLCRNVRGVRGIECVPKALGCREETIRIPHIESNDIQTVQVLKGASESKPSDIEITVTTVDAFLANNGIARVDILKTDTEGYDLEVLKGASAVLSARGIRYLVSEVTLFEADSQHTNLFELRLFLQEFGYELYSFCDGYHEDDGRVPYLNALFRVLD